MSTESVDRFCASKGATLRAADICAHRRFRRGGASCAPSRLAPTAMTVRPKGEPND